MARKKDEETVRRGEEPEGGTFVCLAPEGRNWEGNSPKWQGALKKTGEKDGHPRGKGQTTKGEISGQRWSKQKKGLNYTAWSDGANQPPKGKSWY